MEYVWLCFILLFFSKLVNMFTVLMADSTTTPVERLATKDTSHTELTLSFVEVGGYCCKRFFTCSFSMLVEVPSKISSRIKSGPSHNKTILITKNILIERKKI